MTLTATTVSIKMVIHPDDVTSFHNLGFEVTQEHMAILPDILENVIMDNHYDDLFNALLIADQDIQVER